MEERYSFDTMMGIILAVVMGMILIFNLNIDQFTCKGSEKISNSMMNITHEQRVTYLKEELKHSDDTCNGTETPMNSPLDCCVDRCCEYYNILAKQ